MDEDALSDDAFEIEVTDLRGEPVRTRQSWLPRPPASTPPDDDDFEIEVSDLPATGPALPPAAEESVSAAREPEAEAAAEVERTRGPSPLGPRPRNRTRLLGGAGAAGALVLALAVLLAGSPGTHAALGRYFPTPTATAYGADTFVAADEVPWGRLTVDGRVIARSQSMEQAYHFRLAGGTHEVAYKAEPFVALRCRVSVPAVPSDTCPLAYILNGVPVGVPFHGSSPSQNGPRVLDLGATLDNLPSQQIASLKAAVQALLNQGAIETSVRPGEHYLGLDQTIRVAPVELRASLSLALSTDANNPVQVGNGPPCIAICAFPSQIFDGTSWPLMATAVTGWRIFDARGMLIGATPSSQVDGPSAPITPIPLAVYWQNGWQVSLLVGVDGMFGGWQTISNAAGNVAGETLCNVAQFAAAQQRTPATDYGVVGWCGVAPNPAEGCVVANQATNTGNQPTGEPEYFLYRFGVLLAADDLAHQLNPSLPVADATEQAMAQQAALAAMPPQFRSG